MARYRESTSTDCPSRPAQRQKQWQAQQIEPYAIIIELVTWQKDQMATVATYINRESASLIVNIHGISDGMNIGVKVSNIVAIVAGGIALTSKCTWEASLGKRHVIRPSTAVFK